MKKTGLAILIVGWAITWGGAGPVLAQSKVGTTIGTFMRIEPSARGAV